MIISWDKDSEAGKALALHAVYPGSIPNTAYGILSSAKKIPEHRANSKSWVLPGEAQKQKIGTIAVVHQVGNWPGTQPKQVQSLVLYTVAKYIRSDPWVQSQG